MTSVFGNLLILIIYNDIDQLQWIKGGIRASEESNMFLLDLCSVISSPFVILDLLSLNLSVVSLGLGTKSLIKDTLESI